MKITVTFHSYFRELTGHTHVEEDLAEGTRLADPAFRTQALSMTPEQLAEQLQVHRSTVVNAYDELRARGVIDAYPRKINPAVVAVRPGSAKRPAQAQTIERLDPALDALIVGEVVPGAQLHDEDWMTRLLQTKLFQIVPPANLQAMFMRMQEITVEPGKAIVKQGEDGDYFYVIMSGRCIVTREQPNQKPVRLAELDVGACFGEEALISDSKRNATVTALTRCKLMRLSKDDFQKLLNDPLSRRIDFDAARKMIDTGKARWLDVRLPSEFQNGTLPGAVNLPLYMLRMKLAQLDQNISWIVCCDTGRRSSVAVFVLTQKGYDAFVLEKGIPAAG